MFWLFMETKNNIKNNRKNVIIDVLKFKVAQIPQYFVTFNNETINT